MFFCYRWLLLDLKREFGFFQIMRLWEMLWTNLETDHLRLFVAVAILKEQRDKIMREYALAADCARNFFVIHV